MIYKTTLTFGPVLSSSSEEICDELENGSEPGSLPDLEDNPENVCVEESKVCSPHPCGATSRCCHEGNKDGDTDVALTQLCVWETS